MHFFPRPTYLAEPSPPQGTERESAWWRQSNLELGIETSETIEHATHNMSQLSPNPTVAISVLVVWVTIGLLTARILSRRGHEFRPAAALGATFGPLFIPLALTSVRSESSAEPTVLTEGSDSGGPINVLIALSGSASGVVDLLPLMDMLRSKLGRLTIARTIDFDSALSEEWSDAELQAGIELELASALVGERASPSTVLVPGPFPAALTRFAKKTGHDLLVLTESRFEGADPRQSLYFCNILTSPNDD